MTNVLITGNLTILGAQNVTDNSNIKVVILQQRVPNGSGSGANLAGMNDRTLNYLIDPFNLVTLDAGNLFNFNETGTYNINAMGSTYSVGKNQIYITDDSNVVVKVGSSAYNIDSAVWCGKSILNDTLEVTDTGQSYKMRHYRQGVGNFGNATGSGTDQIYAQIVAIKISE